MARPKILITARQLRSIERLAGLGLTQEQIADALGISADTLERRKAERDDIAAAIERGKAKAAAAVGGALYRQATKGNVRAIRWFEATRFGRSEKQVVETRDGTLEELIRDAAADDTARGAGDGSSGTE